MNIRKYLHLKKSNKPVYSSEHVSWGERLGEDPYIGWIIITSVSFLTAIVLIAFAAQLFFLINSGGIKAIQSSVPVTEHAVLDPKSLDSLVASFTAKASITTALKQGFQGPPDPSQ